MTHQGSCTWLCISRWEPSAPRPQSRRRTRRRWPARRRACFHPNELRQGCREGEGMWGGDHRYFPELRAEEIKRLKEPSGRGGEASELPVRFVSSVVIEGVRFVAQRLPSASSLSQPGLRHGGKAVRREREDAKYRRQTETPGAAESHLANKLENKPN